MLTQSKEIIVSQPFDVRKKLITWLLTLRETGARGLLSEALNGPKIFLWNMKLFSTGAILPHLTVLIRQQFGRVMHHEKPFASLIVHKREAVVLTC